KASLENEQSSIGLRGPRGRVLVRQIAGLIARRIVTDPKAGDRVTQGARLGLIRFGSRTDVFLPLSARPVVKVKPGDRVRNGGTAAWIFCYFYVMAAAIRLARFNVTQAGRAKAYFIGLPSPAAGMTLATYYPFTQTPLYASLHGLPWHLVLTFLMIGLTILMVSNVH